MISFAKDNFAAPVGGGENSIAPPPPAKMAKVEPAHGTDVAMGEALAVGDYSEDEAEFSSLTLGSPPRVGAPSSAASPATTRGTSSASGMTDAQDRRLRILEDKVSAVTVTADHLLTAQAEMVDSISALHTQATGFGKAQESTTNTLASLSDNVAKLVAGLAAAPPTAAPPPVAAPLVVSQPVTTGEPAPSRQPAGVSPPAIAGPCGSAAVAGASAMPY